MNTLLADISEIQRARELLSPCFSGFSMPQAIAWSQAPDSEPTVTTGFDHHLTKPAGVHQLARLLDSIA